MVSRQEEAGLVGIFGIPSASHHACLALIAMQHRGDMVGIAASGDEGAYRHARCGFARTVFTPEILKAMPGQYAIGQTKYSKYASPEPNDQMPFVISRGGGSLAIAFSGNVTNSESLRSQLTEEGAVWHTRNDAEIIAHIIARSRERELRAAVKNAISRLEGAFALLAMDSQTMIAFRSQSGQRPLALGALKIDNGTLATTFASETRALDAIGACYLREVKNGELVCCGPAEIKSETLTALAELPCLREISFLSREDSRVFGLPVQPFREALGRALASSLNGIDFDLITGVPDEATTAAISLAEAVGKPKLYKPAINKTHYPRPRGVDNCPIKLRFQIIGALTKNQRAVVILNHIFGGGAAKAITQMLLNRSIGGAREVHIRVLSPPTIHPCEWGIDIPPREKLLTNRFELDQARQAIGATSLAYVPLEEFAKVMPLGCMKCWQP